MEVELKEVYRGLNLTGILEKGISLQNVSQCLCSKANDIEYIGKRITKERSCIVLIKYNNKLYLEKTWSGSDNRYTVEFREFSGQFEDTEPIEDYRYYIDYCDLEINDKEVFYYSFKANELEKAKKMQKMLGEKLAFIKEIEL